MVPLVLQDGASSHENETEETHSMQPQESDKRWCCIGWVESSAAKGLAEAQREVTGPAEFPCQSMLTDHIEDLKPEFSFLKQDGCH